MTEPLQKFGFKESAYERPNLDWRCGREDQGEPCTLGPSGRGGCPAATCMPVRRGDAWTCGRPDRLGGPCADGPTGARCALPVPPCQPKMHHRKQRGLFARTVVVLTVALLLGVLADGSLRPQAVQPGELSHSHAPLARDCRTCHTGADRGPSGWLEASLSANRAELDSQRCNDCHGFATALLPHSQTEVQLAELTAKAAERPASDPSLLLGLATSLRDLQGAKQQIACATCHREHQGRHADLTSIRDRSCQICHASQFVSLAEGHPEFSDFGAENAGRIKFTHDRHLSDGGHYTKQGRAAPACAGCHQPDTMGVHNPVRSFQTICASCHADALTGRDLTVWQLPGAPVNSVEGIGEWPVVIHDSFDLMDSYIESTESRVTDFAAALLLGDAEGRAAPALKDMRAIANAGLDEEDPDPSQAAAARAGIWAVKDLFAELADGSAEGRARLLARLERLAGRELDPAVLEPLLAALPQAGLRTARARWLPHAADEAPGADSQILFEGKVWDGEDEGSGEWYPAAQEEIQAALLPNWTVGPAFDMTYAVQGHADPFLYAWLELASLLPPQSPALERFLEPEQGFCTSCHRVEQSAMGVTVHWRVAGATRSEQGHTRFAHSPHDQFADVEGCASCHALAERTFPPDAESPARLAAEAVDSDFKLVDYAERQRCAQCHVPERAGDSCLSCHNYHVGELKAPRQADPAIWQHEK